MKNMTYIETKNKEVDNSNLVEENTVDEAYMNTQNDVAVKPYTFRKLNSTDLFPMVKIISKIGLDELTQVLEGDVIKNLILKTKGKKSKETDKSKVVKAEDKVKEGEQKEEGSQVLVGIGIALKLANKILEHIPSCEREIYTLLSNVTGIDVESVKILDLDIFMEMLIDFVMKEEFKSFFKVASKFIKV